MAGTATITISVAMADLGPFPPHSRTFTVTSVDEWAGQRIEVASGGSTTAELPKGGIDTVTGLYIYLVSGGTTASAGLSIDIAAASDWAAGDLVLLSGQAIFLVPVYGAGDETYVKNLSTDTDAVVSFLYFGDNE